MIDDLGIEINDFGSTFKVYPNPTFGNLSVELGNVYNETTVKVYNALGQVLVNESFGSTDTLSIQIAGTTGMYILEIKTEVGKSAKIRVIKSK
ncbi:MAG: T9SS type A sorting domain-containing protein [Crocinitomicaceae bacterium]|nr:T9SS type A sorting domain-containing protein [Crocinitomicaceae bacterium]